MTTKLVNELKLSKQQMSQLNLAPSIDALFTQGVELFKQGNKNSPNPVRELLEQTYQALEPELSAERWMSFSNDIYLDKKAKGYWLLKKSDTFGNFNSGEPVEEVLKVISKKLSDSINDWDIPSLNQLNEIRNLNSAPFSLSRGRPNLGTCLMLYKGTTHIQAIDADSGCGGNKDNGVPALFLQLKQGLDTRILLLNILDCGFTPVSMQNNQEYAKLLSLFHYQKPERFPQHDGLAFLTNHLTTNLNEFLLKQDKVRADIAPYHEKILTDTELGHWSLWQDELETSGMETVQLPEPMVARDPKSSINNGVVGIDFGTKSTVVVYQKDNVNIHPMRIGTGDLSKEIAAFHYENPTIMEFRDLDAFSSAYQAQANRPYTKWQDLAISHTAYNDMFGCAPEQFNTFLDELKQWAGDKNRKLKIVGQQGKVIDLPPFLELSDEDFNPIEIYAYYLGLYINNLNNGIYLDYILSFPVTYELPIREKIIQSFERGLKKSLPAELGLETIESLNVTKGASEPAAYALIALQKYQFEPEGDARVFYSVFDFGGGTTDFDFGIYREAKGAKERRYDYVVEHFGAGGDKFLGGENLLELLAFEVFKKNKNKLLAEKIQFERHPEKDAFAGSEQLLSHSQEAKMNTKLLCQALRPFWEGKEDEASLSSGTMSLNLTNVSGEQKASFELDVASEELTQILTDRIERGVINFFEALRLAFSQHHTALNDIDNIKIFLAGNSSKSKIVTDLFEKYIAKYDQDMGVIEGESRFELYAPLGADDDSNDVEKPTGKTGVAFGLIESREGGSIKVIDHNVTQANDIRFKYYLGESRKGVFKPLIDRETPYHQWIDFIDAGLHKFEIFYTEQPTASTGKVPISDPSIKKTSVKIDCIDEYALVYLRLASPTKIEFVVAHEDGIETQTYLTDIQSLEL